LNRRRFCESALASSAALALPAEALLAQAATAEIRVRTLNHVTLFVSDLARSLDFYQSLFGSPVQARQGSTSVVSLRLGSGPQSLTLAAAPAGETPRIHHYCLGVDDFDLSRILNTLSRRGVTQSESPSPMMAGVRVRGPEEGGADDGTPELFVLDPDGIVVQLQDSRYCAGAGTLGTECGLPEPVTEEGRLAADDLNHVTLSVSNRERSLSFYQTVLDMPIQAYQGTTPLLSIGSGPQFVTAASSTATGATPRRPSIAHVCLTVQDFDPERITGILEDFGITPREGTGNVVGPLTSFVTIRREDRGGAPEGTPELYFTDPDGIYIQLQDKSYCGGSGYLGNVCRQSRTRTKA
jgi:catechol 2,3-dioxygenase-like lactoylglutathione lyase family enzyme